MKQSTLTFDKTITTWDEGIPLGNGDIGCLIWGNANALRFSLDKGDIWDTSGSPENNPDFTYKNLVEWVKTGNTNKMWKTFEKGYCLPNPTKLPVGAIVVDLKTDSVVSSKLDMEHAEAELNVGNIKLKSFVHSNKKVGLLEISTENADVSLDIPKFGALKKKWWQKLTSNGISQSLKKLHYEKYDYTEKVIDDVTIKYFIQKVNAEFSYGVILAAKKDYGKTCISYTIMSSNDGANFIKNAVQLVVSSLNDGYKTLFDSHKEWWKTYWGKSSIDIPDETILRGYHIGNYLLGSGSRKGHFPMPLQGLWTADNGELPPWKGDYHHDLNTQLTYFSYAKANHLEEGECFIDYLLGLECAGKRFSEKFYGVKGLCLPAVMDIKGGALGGWAMYSLSPTNMLWLCDIIANYYKYSLNLSLLTEKIYPYLAEVEKMFKGIFIEKNGKYYLPLSSSPEIHDNTLKAFVTPNSNYDLALLRKFYMTLIEFSTLLGMQSDGYKLTLSKLDQVAVDTDGVLKVCSDERLTVSHRHHSHAMSIFPLRLRDYDKAEDKKIIDATVADLEKLGADAWVGYSFAWLAEFYSVQRNGEKTRDTLDNFYKYFCLPNGFHINGDYMGKGLCSARYRPFTLEGNFCANDAVQEMLLYSHNGVIEPLRAIPKDWENVSFVNLRAEGGILVSAKYENGKLVWLKLEPTKTTDVLLANKFASKFSCNIEYKMVNDFISIHLAENTEVIFEAK